MPTFKKAKTSRHKYVTEHTQQIGSDDEPGDNTPAMTVTWSPVKSQNRTALNPTGEGFCEQVLALQVFWTQRWQYISDCRAQLSGEVEPSL